MSKIKIAVFVFILTLIFLLCAIEVSHELTHGEPLYTFYEEILIILLSTGLILFLIFDLFRKEKVLSDLNAELVNSKYTLLVQDEKLQKAKKEYSRLIKKQFEDWHFTETETQTAYLLLKGLSLKEISELRTIKEKTARQQASNLYSKAGLPGRHALAAWFFEDML